MNDHPKLAAALALAGLLLPLAAHANNYYISQAGSGTMSGTTIGNAAPATFFNNSTNWSTTIGTSGKISPGDTVYLEGQLSTALTIQQSGTAGNPITILFDTGAFMSAPFWGVSPTVPAGAINDAGFSYIVIDGGATGTIGGVNGNASKVNGYITATANGTNLANQESSVGVYVTNASNVTVQNLAVTNMYVRVGGPDESTGSSNTAGVWFSWSSGSQSNLTVNNCLFHDEFAGIKCYYFSGSNVTDSFVTAYNCNWSAHCGDGDPGGTMSNFTVHDCYFHDWANWDDSNLNQNHHDGVFAYENSSGSLTGITVYNNTFGPDFSNDLILNGQSTPTDESTSTIYINTYVYNVLIYNNTFISASATDYPSDGMIYLFPEASITSTYSILNNTFLGQGGGIGVNFTPQGVGVGVQTVNIENNLFDNMGTFISIFDDATVTLNSTNNLAYGNPASPFSFSPTSSSLFKTVSAWQGLGYDTNLITTNPQLSNTNQLLNTSPAVDAGVSLASYFTTDAFGTPRPQGVAWDIGAFELPQGAPVAIVNPSAANVASGATATYTADFLGAPTLSISWQSSPDGVNWTTISNGGAYSNATTPTLSVLANSGLNGLQYRAVATNGDGTANSTGALLTVEFAPSILSQPSSQTVTAGGTTSFSVTASGDPTPTYQWQVNSGGSWSNVTNTGPYSGATTSTLTITNAGPALNSYGYQVIVSNGVSPNAISTIANLTVNYAPIFSTQPASTTVVAGNSANFNAVVSANPAATYQWEISTNGSGGPWNPVVSGGGVTYSGANTTSLMVAGTTAALNGAEYELFATNTIGTTPSNPATLTVKFAPIFSTQPSNTTINAGQGTTLTGVVSSNPAVTSYQWEFSTNNGGTWTPITAGNAGSTYTNYTSANLGINSATAAMNGYEYELVATNSVNPTDSSPATLTVDFAPTVTTQPTAQTVIAGNTATFTADGSSNPTASLQWQVNTGGSWTNLTNSAPYSGVTTGTLTITSAPADLNGNQYQLVATNNLGSVTTNAVTLTVQYAASFGTQPTDDTVVEGFDASFDVAAAANPNPTIQWQISTDDGSIWSNVSNGTVNGVTYSGATTDLLSIDDTILSMDGDEFRAVATNSVAGVDSNAATLTVELNTPTVNSSAYANGTINASFTYTITGTNTPTGYSASTLPAGLTLDTTSGVISGTPTVAGYFQITIGATNAHGTGTATLNLALAPAADPVVNSSSSAAVLTGTQFSYTITGTNFPSTFATTTLPTGLTLNANTGVISGVPTVGGTYQITLSASNQTGTGQGPLTITIETVPPSSITSASTASAQVGAQFSFTVTGTNAPYIFTALGLPPGLAIDTSTGVISGTPTQTGTFDATVRVTNGTGTTDGSLTITVTSANQIYLGDLGGNQASSTNGVHNLSEGVGGSIAAYVNSSGTGGTLIGYVTSIQAGFLVNFNLVNGAFSAQTTSLTSNGSGQTLTFNGTIANGVLSGNIVELSLPFSVQVDPTSGTSSGVSGLYASGNVFSVVGTQGEVFVLAVTANGVSAGTGTVSSNGSISVQTSQGVTVTGSVNAQSGITGSISGGTGGSVSFSGSASASAPQVTPASQTVNAGASVTLSAATSGATAYQWQYYGSNIAGATSSTYTLSNIGEYQGGVFTCMVTTGSGTASSTPATVAVDVNARLTNLSGRAYVGSGANQLVSGFIVQGSGSKHVLLRGDGPTLSLFGVSGALSKPVLTLFDSSQAEIASDTGWINAIVSGNSSVQATIADATSQLFSEVGAFALSLSAADSAMSATVPVGSYTAQVTGASSSTGIAIAEIYDADTGTPAARLVNLSLNSYAGTGANASTVGFAVGGTTSETVLLRGVGPTLSSFGVGNVLAAPQLVLYDSNGSVIATNRGWANAPQLGSSPVQAGVNAASASIMSRVGAFTLPSGSADCAMVVTLPPGETYTLAVTGQNGSTGTALVEIYEVP